MSFSIAVITVSFLVGFAMKRGGLCTYAAVLQIIRQRRAERLLVFLGAAAWATLTIVPLSWYWPQVASLARVHDQLALALVGGMVIGIGAWLNKGCVFGTFVQLVGGNLTYLATLLGMSAGVAVAHHFLLARMPTASEVSIVSQPGFVAAGWIMVAGLFVVSLASRAKQWCLGSSLPGSQHHRSRATMIMLTLGIGGGFLFATVSGWSYAAVIGKTIVKVLDPTTGGPGHLAVLCALAMVLGGILAAVTAGSFAIRAPRLRPFLYSLVGGVLMSSAAMAVPGGNDGMLLQGIPSLAPHALVAYLAMVVTMLLLVSLSRDKGC
jgi:uncharacterized membrane protein YedE/YeeE